MSGQNQDECGNGTECDRHNFISQTYPLSTDEDANADSGELFADMFADFEPHNTTDGSYRGTMAKVKATELQYQQVFEQKLVEANNNLKRERIRVSIKQTGNSLQLRATLPLKPSDKAMLRQGERSVSKEKKQYDLSLGIPANLEGLKTAIEESYELGKLIARHTFQWNEKYLGIKSREKQEIKTIGELLDIFEEKYYQTRQKTITSQNTFANYISVIKRNFPLTYLATKNNFEDIINSSQGNKKNELIAVTSVFIKTFQLGFTLDVTRDSVTPAHREIPEDDKIISSIYLFEKFAINRKNTNISDEVDTWEMWRWVYGMLATFGLRPRELFVEPDINWWMSPQNIDHTWKVNKNTKTGYREVIPFVPEWIGLFDLHNPKPLKILEKKVTKIASVQNINWMRRDISRWFRKVGIEFQPYDLRHACAIRAHLQGIPIKAAADNLGHTVDEHTKTYQRWFGIENRKKAFGEVISQKSLIELQKNEILALRMENERLRLEVEKLKFSESI
ncbi:site-specific integrase [Calothrix sp. 336/3]|uniref:site-specific integrase n=1 Tax=Calothrix sp. 336/3 TaxID=1337936 RepID=UPI0004E3DCC8|nr:site-specific integrase [Calothrix sp. 336/3]AKG23036.1 ethanolamine utilization protein EutM [Calothrix sp. 336/3]